MKKSLMYVILLFIAWAVSAAAIQTPPSAILRLEAAVCNNVFGLHSRYSMKYAVNRLSSMEIEREGEDYEGRTGVSATGKISDFWYDANGNLGRDMSRGILSTNYNRLNLPTDVYFINGHRQTIEYDGFGQKRSVSYSQTSDPILGTMMGVPEDSAYTLQGRRDYIGPHVFVGDSLEYSAFPGGYFTPEGVFYYITDWQGNNIAVFSDKGGLVQQTTYYPYGEPTIESSGQRYLFGGKEREHAGGRNSYDYGPRSLTPSGNWDSTDRNSESYYPISPFSYCGGDPINRVDRDGNDIVILGKENSSIALTTDLIDISVNASSFGVNWGGNYVLQGEELLSATLDIVGIVDPSGVADGLNASLQAKNGDWAGAAISAVGLVPYVGDIAKAGKIGKDVEIIQTTINSAKTTTSVSTLRKQAVRQAWKDEQQLVKEGKGSRRWTKAEKEELLRTGKIKGYEGHHINNVKDHPELAGNPNNIQFVKRDEHLDAHGGNFSNETHGELLNRDPNKF